MRKPTLMELRNKINEIQEELQSQPVFFREEDPLAGQCIMNIELADLGGIIYFSSKPSVHGPWGHTIAIVATQGSNEGKVVDITQKQGIVGIVQDARKPTSIEIGLTQMFGFDGWQRRK
jgi:hypothetical protein